MANHTRRTKTGVWINRNGKPLPHLKRWGVWVQDRYRLIKKTR